MAEELILKQQFNNATEGQVMLPRGASRGASRKSRKLVGSKFEDDLLFNDDMAKFLARQSNSELNKGDSGDEEDQMDRMLQK